MRLNIGRVAVKSSGRELLSAVCASTPPSPHQRRSLLLERNQSDQTRPDMAADRPGASLEDMDEVHASDLGLLEEHGGHIPKRHARVTVKYNRKELQRRLDVEKWIDLSLDRLYLGQEGDMPEELNIDDLIDLPNDEERVKKLQELLGKCRNNTETFIKEVVAKLDGVHKQDELQSEGIEHPIICHSHYRHEPYHFNSPHHPHHTGGQNQTL